MLPLIVGRTLKALIDAYAQYAVGVFDDLAATAQRFTQTTGRTEPDLTNHAYYQPFVDQYIQLLDMTKPVFDALAGIPEPPGAR
jgi:sugar (pentulose or hexulose) kinase